MKLINSKTKQEITVGQKVMSFRNEEYTVTGWQEPQHAGSTGRIYTDDGRGYFPSVFDCEFTD